MLFYQPTAPGGWTQLTLFNDALPRVVNGVGGGNGGTNGYSSVMAQSVVGSHALTVSEMPSHTHGIGPNTDAATWEGGDSLLGGGSGGAPAIVEILPTGGGAAHTHTLTMDIYYVDMIIASMN
jgi:microcystin-dependent protein